MFHRRKDMDAFSMLHHIHGYCVHPTISHYSCDMNQEFPRRPFRELRVVSWAKSRPKTMVLRRPLYKRLSQLYTINYEVKATDSCHCSFVLVLSFWRLVQKVTWNIFPGGCVEIGWRVGIADIDSYRYGTNLHCSLQRKTRFEIKYFA